MGRLVGVVESRLLVSVGFVLLAVSGVWLGRINLRGGMVNIALATVVNGLATRSSSSR